MERKVISWQTVDISGFVKTHCMDGQVEVCVCVCVVVCMCVLGGLPPLLVQDVAM